MHRFFLKEMLKGKEGGEIASFSTGRIKPLSFNLYLSLQHQKGFHSS